jgi:hydroxyacylglutathione hydrolase
MEYRIIPVTPFEQNCTLLWCTETMKGAFVDPGGDIERLLAASAKLGVSVEKILLTHGHIDHAGGAGELAAQLGVPIEGPQREEASGSTSSWRRPGLRLPAGAGLHPDRWLEDGDTVTVGKETLQVIFTPGHTPGHVVFFHAPSKLALVGDVLFAGSIGRTDFPRGDYQTLIDSIHLKLWPLGDDVKFISGHGPMSTFGEERRSNPFVGDGA